MVFGEQALSFVAVVWIWGKCAVGDKPGKGEVMTVCSALAW